MVRDWGDLRPTTPPSENGEEKMESLKELHAAYASFFATMTNDAYARGDLVAAYEFARRNKEAIRELHNCK